MAKKEGTKIPKEVIASSTPINEYLSAKYKYSFAFVTVSRRLLTILDQTFGQMTEDKDDIIMRYGIGAKTEIPMVLNRIRILAKEIQQNKQFVLFYSAGSDVQKWNQFVEEQTEVEGNVPRWYTTVWLYSECYMYRRLHEILSTTRHLTNLDPFEKQKQGTIISSLKAVEVISNYMMNELSKPFNGHDTDVMNGFVRLMYMCLWGNKADLSNTCGKKLSSVTDPLEQVEQLRDNILVDDSKEAWPLLTNPGIQSSIVDFVLDNAGYELFIDLCFADFLCTFSLAEKIRLHFKAIPWFVSDATPNDFKWLLNSLKNQKNSNVVALSERWRDYLKESKWIYTAEDFWTLPYVYDEMSKRDPELYKKLSNSTLIIFKGDLNYRKLVGERNWDPTFRFSSAVGNFSPSNLIALRTIKADLICGLQEGKAEELNALDRKWMLNGDYAVIQFMENQSASPTD